MATTGDHPEVVGKLIITVEDQYGYDAHGYDGQADSLKSFMDKIEGTMPADSETASRIGLRLIAEVLGAAGQRYLSRIFLDQYSEAVINATSLPEGYDPRFTKGIPDRVAIAVGKTMFDDILKLTQVVNAMDPSLGQGVQA